MVTPITYPHPTQDVCANLFSNNAVIDLAGEYDLPDGITAKSVDSLPLVVREDQWVQFEDQYIHLNREGLYRFANWGRVRFDGPDCRPEILDSRKSSAAVILYKENILNLLGCFAVLTVHGHAHDLLSHEDRLAKMKKGTIALTCGSIAGFMCRLLTDMGWRTRLFQCLRIEGPYDSYNCGHLLFEFIWPALDKWVLADVDAHQMFVKNGTFLNMAEVKDLIERGDDFDLYPLTPAGLGVIDTAEPVGTDFTGMAMFDHMLLDPNLLKQWHRRMFAVVAVVEPNKPGYFYCRDPHGRERAHSYNSWFVPMEKETWIKTYYGRSE